MTELAKKTGHYLLLIVITALATGVMWWVSKKNTDNGLLTDSDLSAPPPAAGVRTPVAVAAMRPKVCELTIRYAGKVQPWESYSLGFEIGGRVESLGQDGQGQPLDDGAPVKAGQLLARLDDRILRARRSEAVAQLELADSDYNRDSRLRERGGQAITDAEYQETLTNLALRKAQLTVATKNLEDALLLSPVDGVISRRMVESGESVTAHQMVFDVVQVSDVLLTVNVPESRVRELQLRQRRVAEARQEENAGSPEDRVFRARVTLEGRDAFGDAWPPIDAEVYRIAQTADEQTGLFEVDIRIPNGSGLLRPGMVASAQIVTDRLFAYELPESAVIFRGTQAYVFTIDPEPADMQVMFWRVGETTLTRARRIDLRRWIDQGDRILVPAESFRGGAIVTSGQRRLTDDQPVRVVNPEALGDESVAQTAGKNPTASDSAASVAATNDKR